jgi:hypothetical protein
MNIFSSFGPVVVRLSNSYEFNSQSASLAPYALLSCCFDFNSNRCRSINVLKYASECNKLDGYSLLIFGHMFGTTRVLV